MHELLLGAVRHHRDDEHAGREHQRFARLIKAVLILAEFIKHSASKTLRFSDFELSLRIGANDASGKMQQYAP